MKHSNMVGRARFVIPLLWVLANIWFSECFLPGNSPLKIASRRANSFGGLSGYRSNQLQPLKATGGGILPAEKILGQAKYEGIDEDTTKRIIELAEKSIKEWDIQVTDFLRPPEYAALERILAPLVDVEACALGGYPLAERRRLLLARGEAGLLLPGGGGGGGAAAAAGEGEGAAAAAAAAGLLRDEHLRAVGIQGNFLFDPANHRDFLGSILGTGIVREKVGDIIITGERGAQVIVTPEIAEYLCIKLTKVRNTSVTCSIIPFEQLNVAPPKKKQVQSVEASLRADAVISAGMGMSRSKMADMIKSGDVLINWKEISSTKKEVKEGDVVTVRGKGRVEILEIVKTAKGRFRVTMNKLT